MNEAEALFRFFDSTDDVDVVERNLPHWMQAKTICFITWRTWDSIPADVARNWHQERVAWLKKHAIDQQGERLQAELARLPKVVRCEYYQLFSARWSALLDNCLGSCPLRDPAKARVVADSLLHFDNERYVMTDFVVMPNHVHLLAGFERPEGMLQQCESWKHWTATQLNRMLGRKGHFWETDSFDHLVRSEEQWRYFRQYIRDNPTGAKLNPGEYVHYSREIK